MNVPAAIANPARQASFVKREAQERMSVSVSSHARYEIRFTRNELSDDLATNRHEYCGLSPSSVFLISICHPCTEYGAQDNAQHVQNLSVPAIQTDV